MFGSVPVIAGRTPHSQLVSSMTGLSVTTPTTATASQAAKQLFNSPSPMVGHHQTVNRQGSECVFFYMKKKSPLNCEISLKTTQKRVIVLKFPLPIKKNTP